MALQPLWTFLIYTQNKTWNRHAQEGKEEHKNIQRNDNEREREKKNKCIKRIRKSEFVHLGQSVI
jgi:hypothetical protein